MAIQEQLGKLKEVAPRSVTFLTDVWTEMKKVHWPTRKETYAATIVVVAVTILIAVFLGLVDFAISHAVQAILS